jgi:outer membrane protein assembly factor BamA
MRLALCIVALLGSVSTLCQAFPITKIVTHGNSQVSTRELGEYLHSLSENPYRNIDNRSELLLAAQHVQDLIVEYYQQHGFLRANIDSLQTTLSVPPDSAQGYAIQLYLSEGRQYRFHAIEGTRALSIASGDIYSDAKLRDAIDELLKDFEQRGYPLAKVQIASVELSDDTDVRFGLVDIALVVSQGPQARIGKIVIEDNAVTQPEVITRELGLRSGAYYNAEELAAARTRVERLGFFESVAEPELYLARDSSVTVLLHVKEANTSAIDGVLGYIPPRNSNESGYVSGLADLSFRNISGTARSASLMYDRRTQESQTLQVAYLEPWLLGYPLNAQVGFLERQQDTTFTRTTFNGDLSLRFTSSITLVGHVAIDRVIPSNQPNAPFTTYDSKSVTTGLSASVDTRDNTIAPTYGVLALLGATYGVKSIYGPAIALDSATPLTEGVRTIVFDANGYHSIGAPTLIGAVGLHARSVSLESGLLDASDLYRIGGLFTMRGYREEEILASRYAYANAEVRFMTGHYSFFDLFCDNGLTIKDSTQNAPAEQARYLLSYGIGAQLESPLGILAVSIGLARGEPVDQAKFHFGLVKQF